MSAPAGYDRDARPDVTRSFSVHLSHLQASRGLQCVQLAVLSQSNTAAQETGPQDTDRRKEQEIMNPSQANDKSGRRNVMKRGFWGALLIAIAAIFATAGVRLGASASDEPSTIRARQAGVRSVSAASEQASTNPEVQSPAADLAGPDIANADRDTLDLQLD